MRNTQLFGLVFVSGLVLADDVGFRVVTLDQGLVKGYKSSEGDFFAFYGIPYATAPTGPDKFKAPLPPPIWTGIFEAVNKEISCPQTASPMASPSGNQEDCLIANIFVPSKTDKPLPVLVYVHGGAYLVGSANVFKVNAMVNEGKFIVVIFNYRLGVHGFLCLGTETAPGNAGMKDQLALLRWVNKNIVHFGGDPSDVTISGGSAGASAVELLMLSKTTKGLFNKVIPDSGNAVSVWSVQIDPLENAKKFARFHNITTDDINILEDFCKEATYEQLVTFPFMSQKDSTFVMVPCVERDIGIERFLDEAPIEILRRRNFFKVPVLIGFSNMEGLLRAANFEHWKKEMTQNFATFLPADLQFKNADEKERVAKKVKAFYFDVDKIDQDTLIGYVNYFSDVFFTYPALRTVKLLAEAGNDNVYLYQYSYSDNFTVANRIFPHLGGADHCSQSMTMIDITFMPQDESKITDDYQSMKRLTKQLWVNFILTGKPLPEPTSDFPEGWPATSANHSPYMELNLPAELRDTLIPERYRFWDDIYEKYYRTPVPPPNPGGHSEL